MNKLINSTIISLLTLVLIITTFGFNPNIVNASLNVEAESAILVDADTGQILYEKNADIKLPPASMTKVMTEYLVLEAINDGRISWDTTTQISDYAYRISADVTSSGIGLIQNKDYTVRELYEGMAIISDNATTIALAELVAGSEGEFVRMMNEKGEEMGLKDFQFVNSTGLSNTSLGDDYPEGTSPDADNLLSARATALLAYHLVNDYPEALDFSSTVRSELDGYPLENLNWMLPWNNTNFAQFYFEGVDGLKTGFTTAAGYSFVGTATQDGRRLITVVMRTDSQGQRFIETKNLMNYGFRDFSEQELFPSGYQLEEVTALPVSKGKDDEVAIEINDSFTSVIRNGEEDSYSVEYQFIDELLNENGELVAPIEEGQVVGTAKLVYEGNADYGHIVGDVQTVDIITTHSVEKSNWFMLAMGAVGDFFSGIFSSVTDAISGWFS